MKQQRSAFTLVEMLVVIGIILVLATLTVLFMPRIMERQRATEGARLVHGWLLTARERAKRDQIPRGVRLLYDSGFARSLVYIEQPDDFTGGTLIANGTTTVTFTGVDFTGGFVAPALWLVQPGDFLEVPSPAFSQSQVFQIVNPITGSSLTTIRPVPLQTTQNYRIGRFPRLSIGEAVLQLPQNVAIDLTDPTTGLFNPILGRSRITPEANGYLNILFAPSGEVLGKGASTGKIILWVRDISQDNLEGDQTLIAVYTRTGMIAAQPADPSNNYATPYTFTQDGRSSGF